jgi:two-component system, chemotaxis family, chemotaxis protein CheY
MVDYEKISVLVVEDEDYTRKLITRLMSQMGIRKVYEAADGGGGIEQVVRMRPNIVFCDIHMKPMDGLEFLSTLQAMKLPALAQTPVVFLTADAQQETVFRAKQLNVRGYLVKPVSLSAMKSRIDAVLAR